MPKKKAKDEELSQAEMVEALGAVLDPLVSHQPNNFIDEQPGVEDDGLLDQLLTEEEIRQQMNAILRRMPAQRQKLTEAFRARAEKYARTWVGIKLLDPAYMHTEAAKEMVQKFAEQISEKKHKPLTIPDTQALLTVDLGDLQTQYEIAEMIVKMDQEQYHQLNKQLQWYMNMKNFTGPTVPMGRNPISATDAIYKGLGGNETVTPAGPFDEPEIDYKDYTPAEVASAIKEGILEPSSAALAYCGLTPEEASSISEASVRGEDMMPDPFETRVEPELKDCEGVPIHEPEELPEEPPEDHWLDKLVAERDALKVTPESIKEEEAPVVMTDVGLTIGGIYGRPTYREHMAEQAALKSPTPVKDAIERIAQEKSVLAKVMDDPAALAAADEEVLGPRDDENNPQYVDPDPYAWMNNKL